MKSDQQNGAYAGDMIRVNGTGEQNPVRQRSFNFQPQRDISAYELALLLEVILTSIACGDLDAAYERLPPEAKRHLIIC